MQGNRVNTRFSYFFLFSLLCLFISCGGTTGNILPQTTIPIPENEDSEGLVISSPDESGLVVIQGSENLLPESMSVIVQVVSSTNQTTESSSRISNSVSTSQLNAEICGEEIPVCPELNGDNKCHNEGKENGSFEFEVPAELSDTIKLWYQDEQTCETTDHIEVEIQNKDVKIDKEDVEIIDDQSSSGDGQSEAEAQQIVEEELVEEELAEETDTGVYQEEYYDDTLDGGGVTEFIITSFAQISEYVVNVPFYKVAGNKLIVVVGLDLTETVESEKFYYIIKARWENQTWVIKAYDLVDVTDSPVSAQYVLKFDDSGKLWHAIRIYISEFGIIYEYDINDLGRVIEYYWGDATANNYDAYDDA